MHISTREVSADCASVQAPFDRASEAVGAAHALSREISSKAAEVESDRIVSGVVVDKMRHAGLFGLVAPKMFGGSELGVEALVRVVIEVASACGSTGWVCGVLSGHSWMLSMFPAAAQREIAKDTGALIATVFRFGGELVPEGDGYRLTGGAGRFCTGIDHSDWVIVGGAVKRAGAPPEPRFLLVPRSEVEIVDDWFTLGMRGTGSRSIKVANAFIPEHRTMLFSDALAGSSPGAAFHQKPIYRMSFTNVIPYSLVGAPLGMARGAVACFAENLKKSIESAPPREGLEAAQLRLARASTAIDGAIALVLSDAASVDAITDPTHLDELASRQLPRNCSWAVQTCRDAVNELYQGSGASAIYNGSVIQRIWRDINSAAQHFGFTEDSAMISYAKSRLGTKPETHSIPKSSTSV